MDSLRVASESRALDVMDEKGRTASEIASELLLSREEAAKKQAAEVQAREEHLRSTRIPLEEKWCIAYHRREQRCLVTIGELNARLGENPNASDQIGDLPSSSDGNIAVRTSTLEILLHERFIQVMADRIDQGDLRGIGIGAWQTHLTETASAVGEARLRRLYRKHYRILFASKKKASLWMLGSSDSAFTDSLAKQSIRADMTMKNQPGSRIIDSASARTFQWQKFISQDLPLDMSQVIDSIEEGKMSRVFRCRFGWSVVMVTKLDWIPEISFLDALPLLLELAAIEDLYPPSRNQFAEPTHQGERIAKATNSETPLKEEMTIKTWLLPQSTSSNGKRAFKPTWADTNRVSSILLRQGDLPIDPGSGYFKNLILNRIGILQNKYGTWYFRLPENELESRKLILASPSLKGIRSLFRDEELIYGLKQAKFDAKAKEIEFKSRLAADHLANSKVELENLDGSSALDSAFKLWKIEYVFVDTKLLKI